MKNIKIIFKYLYYNIMINWNYIIMINYDYIPIMFTLLSVSTFTYYYYFNNADNHDHDYSYKTISYKEPKRIINPNKKGKNVSFSENVKVILIPNRFNN